MAATQKGTGSLTLGAPQTTAATYITIPSGGIIRSVSPTSGNVDFEDFKDADGAFHTRLTYEARMKAVTVVLEGAAYSKAAGDVDGSSSNYYVEDVSVEHVAGVLRTTIKLTRIPTIA